MRQRGDHWLKFTHLRWWARDPHTDPFATVHIGRTIPPVAVHYMMPAYLWAEDTMMLHTGSLPLQSGPSFELHRTTAPPRKDWMLLRLEPQSSLECAGGSGQ